MTRPFFSLRKVRCIKVCCMVAAVAVSVAAVSEPTCGRALQASAQRETRDERTQKLINEGRAALERNDEAAAKTLFERALSIEPNNVEAHTYLGVLADRAGDIKEAERHFSAAAIAAPFLPSARNNYGVILLRANKTELAAAQFEASLKLDQNQPSALVNLAQIRFSGGKPADLNAARDLFRRAHSISPEADVARALVVIALRLGEKETAVADYRDYAGRISGNNDSEAASQSSRRELGQALLEAGLVEEAILELTAATALEPSDAVAVISLARAYLSRKDIPAAGRTLESAVARGLDTAPVYAALADVYEAGGYVENAIPAMRLAIARDPRNEAYHLRYGMLLIDTKAPAAAIIRLQEAVKEFPASSRLWLALGIAQLVHGLGADALKSFEQAVGLDPKSVAALAYLGTAHAEKGQYEEAVAFYERAIGINDKLSVPYYLAADALLKQAGASSARVEKYLRRAVELDPSFSSARLALAKLHIRAQRWEEAAAQLERVVELDASRAEAHYQLGQVYIRLKRREDAERVLATFKKLSEEQKEQKDNERRELVRRLANVRF